MSYDSAATIDAFLRKRGSPMAGLGSVFVGLGKKYGVDPRLVVSISGIESGFGKHILGSFNAWGWGPGHPFSSWEEGIATVTKGLKSGYISQGLLTPAQIAARYAPGSAGNDEGNWAKTVSGFMTDLGAPMGTPTGSAAGAQPKPFSAKPLAVPKTANFQAAGLANLQQIAMTGRADPFAMMQSFSQGRALDAQVAQANLHPDPRPTDTPATDPNFTAGVPVADLTSTGGTHPTMGLPGYPAKDYFAPAGSLVLAPVGGKIIRLSGYDPSQGPTQGPHGPLGWSVYIQGNDGHTYYLTHMGGRTVHVGDTVLAGQPIGTVANYAQYGTPSHIHMGVR